MIAIKEFSRQYESGFKAKIVLRPKFKQKFYGLIVNFGSADPQKPAGLAHFLEHKLFAKKDGDLSHQFEKAGAEVNAFTSLNETMYYCSGLNFGPSLIRLLFRLVGEPFFTEQNVEQEKPIIQQELAMYQDQPAWAINHALMKIMFSASNLASDVAGSKDTIEAVTQSALAEIYHENYLADRMSFVACGDFSPYQVQSIFALVKKEQARYFKRSAKKFPFIKEKTISAPADLTLANGHHSHFFGVGIKLSKFKKVLSSRDLAQTIIEIMLESKLSTMSPWFQKMKSHGWLVNALQIAMSYSREGDFVTVFGLSTHPKEVIAAIKKELQQPLRAKDVSFLQSAWALAKKEYLAAYLRGCDDLSYLAVATAEASLEGEKPRNNLRQLETMSFSAFEHYYQDLMADCYLCSAHFK